MVALELRSVVRSALFVGLVVLVFARANAESRVLDGHPVSMLKAHGWCIVPGNNIPSWEAPSISTNAAARPCSPATVTAARPGRAAYAATLRGVGGEMASPAGGGRGGAPFRPTARPGAASSCLRNSNSAKREWSPKSAVDEILRPSYLHEAGRGRGQVDPR